MELQYRELRAEELPKWFDHVDEVFKTPKEYFVCHWEQDPDRELSGILVCMDNDKIVGTVRVFHRKIIVNSHILSMGGIGEVSTSVQYRRRGIATHLLQMAIAYMNQHHMSISVLSGSQNIYSQLGWQPIPYSISHTKIPSTNIPTTKPENQTPDIIIQKCNYKNLPNQEKQKIQHIYQQTSVRYSGTIVRSGPYWDTWVSVSLSYQLRDAWIIKETKEGNVIGYFSVKIIQNKNKVRILEFLVLEEVWCSHAKYVFENAVYRMLMEKNLSGARISYPTPLGCFGEISKTSIKKHQMYKILDGSSPEETKMLQLFFEDSIARHVWWGTDSF